MIDVDQILARMATAIQSSDFPDRSTIATVLGLDLSAATTTVTTGGELAIAGGRLSGRPEMKVGIAGLLKPQKALHIVFLDSDIPFESYFKQNSAVEYRVQPSPRSEGLALTFRVNGVDCGITASARDGVVQTLFCTASDDSMTSC